MSPVLRGPNQRRGPDPKRVPTTLLAVALSLNCAACEARDDQAHREQPATVQPTDSGALSDAARIAALEERIEADRRRLGVPGVAVVIVKEDRVILLRGFGLRDVERGLPVTPRTLFPIGSCTKSFTALATVRSADAGVLALDDSPKRFLPYFALQDPEADAGVTLRDLLSHRSGVPDDLPAGWFERYPTARQLISAAMRSRPTARPGSRFQYNNYMYVALGEALAAAHASTFENVLTTQVLGPLGMRATSLSISRMIQSADFSYGYSEDASRRRLPMDTLDYLTGILAAGGINSNAEEMANWIRMLLGGGVLNGDRLVSDAGFRELMTPAIATQSGHYGLGMEMAEWHGERLYYHRGGVLGFAARFDILADRRLGWAILANVDDQALANAIREAIHEHLINS